jgi:hypothetical protein
MELSSKRPSVFIYGALCCAPFLYLVWFAFEHFLDTPKVDQWDHARLLEKYLSGELSFKHLWRQHNAHRSLFPKLIILPLAKTTHWNHAYEIAVILLCALTTYLAVVWSLLKLYCKRTDGRRIFWINAASLSLLFFSLSQYKNWLWGLQIQVLLCVMAVVLGLCILSHRLTTGRVIAALALGFIATHSFANGLVYWVVALLPLGLAPVADTRTRKRLLCIWVFFGSLAVISFFYGFRPEGKGLGALIHAPVRHILYSLVFLGNPIVPRSLPGAMGAGILGLCLLGGLTQQLVSRYRTPIRDLLPFLSFALFAVGSAAMTAVGRSHFGYEQALRLRYITLAQLLWVANITLLFLTLTAQHKAVVGRSLAKVGISGLLVALLLSIAIGHIQQTDAARAHSYRINRTARAIVSQFPVLADQNLKVLALNKRRALVFLPFLEKNKLSLFRSR